MDDNEQATIEYDDMDTPGYYLYPVEDRADSHGPFEDEDEARAYAAENGFTIVPTEN